jgi:3-(3-hydroxy-phenyl)propionate hydroxylase
MSAPIAVVGGGPVGLVVALAFAAEGVPVVVLEADADGVRAEWRGSTLHPPTLELLDRIDLASVAVSGGVRVDRLQYRDLELGRVAEFDYGVLDGKTAYPFRIQYEQYKLLRQLRAAAADSPNIELRYGQRVVTVDQDDDRVAITVRRDDGAAE